MRRSYYRPYEGRRQRLWLRVLCGLLAAGLLLFAVLEGIVLAGGHTRLREDQPPETMVILGCQVMERGPSELLQDRLDTALDYLETQPDMTVVVSGGQGSNEPESEAACMRDYLVEHGVESGRILMEDQSHSTAENLRFTQQVLEDNGLEADGGLLIVSNGFHLARVRMLAERYYGEEVSTLAAPSSHLPSRVWMYLREPLALLKSFLLD